MTHCRSSLACSPHHTHSCILRMLLARSPICTLQHHCYRPSPRGAHPRYVSHPFTITINTAACVVSHPHFILPQPDSSTLNAHTLLNDIVPASITRSDIDLEWTIAFNLTLLLPISPCPCSPLRPSTRPHSALTSLDLARHPLVPAYTYRLI
ncbi:hypothetical protein BD310DRAFT_143537 [Dichomitus squalens]|uniref:Uncharacterized protein n=1 Tax=Dichomitus squalens TaxID=114155 RepID=A0A4Q9PII2_9APHY|nr:hypothetical protein BD310DRAFT_143537 [Dichomitus squalens]